MNNDIIRMTRELAKAIVSDEIYTNYSNAKAAVECDGKLTEQTEELERLRGEYFRFQESDPVKAAGIEKQFSDLYDEIMVNPNMKTFNFARQELDDTMTYIIGILNMSVNGHDPDTCEPDISAGGCSGNCSGCSGC